MLVNHLLDTLTFDLEAAEHLRDAVKAALGDADGDCDKCWLTLERLDGLIKYLKCTAVSDVL